jgi:hypothetical protein
MRKRSIVESDLTSEFVVASTLRGNNDECFSALVPSFAQTDSWPSVSPWLKLPSGLSDKKSIRGPIVHGQTEAAPLGGKITTSSSPRADSRIFSTATSSAHFCSQCHLAELAISFDVDITVRISGRLLVTHSQSFSTPLRSGTLGFQSKR